MGEDLDGLWGELADGFAEVEAEFKASDVRDEDAKANGIPLWAYKAYMDMQEAREEAVARGDGDQLISEEESLEKFMETFVEPLRKAKALVSYDGEPTKSPGDMKGRLTIELEGREIFNFFMCLKVGEGSLRAAGPMALIMGGLNPNMDDVVAAMRSGGAVSQALLLCCSEDLELQELDARTG